jgi:hypothetical protein
MDELISTIFQTCEAMLADLLAFVPPVGSPLFMPLLGGLLAAALLLFVWLMIRMRRHRLNARASKVFGREVTFEDVSAEAADGENANAHANARSAENGTAVKGVAPAGDGPAPGPTAANAEAQPTGFTFFKRKPKTADCTVVSETGNAEPNAGDADGDDNAVLAGLEQEMLAMRQLYLDGMISKEVYVTETRALYHKAQGRMT